MQSSVKQPEAMICVFAGSSAGHDPQLAETVKQFGRMMAARNIGLVYGGGRTGLMGAIADGVIEGGGYTVGIIPKFLENIEIAHQGLSELVITDSMHERKSRMYDLADRFIVLPGGYGTMEEMFEVITWCQLKLMQKPITLFNYEEFWSPMLTMINLSSEAGFIRPYQLGLVDVRDNLDALADMLEQPENP